MKNLKKVLSVVLAVALAFSLTTFAGATDTTTTSTTPAATGFTDQSKIDAPYIEAVGVMNNLGILAGDDTGAFNPQTVLTREQGTKIISYVMLGKNVADNLRAYVASFSDVDAGRWSAGYIAYCVKEGIVNGYGDGTFGPEDTLTGVQFAKMLLVALGHGQAGEYTGDNWSITVLKDALTQGLFNGNLGADYTTGITREAAALYALNTLNTPTVTAQYQWDNGVQHVSTYAIDKTTLGNQKYTLNSVTDVLTQNQASTGSSLKGKSTIGTLTVPVTTTLDQIGSNVEYYTWSVNGTTTYSSKAYNAAKNTIVQVPSNLVESNPTSIQQTVSSWLSANGLSLSGKNADTKGANYVITDSAAKLQDSDLIGVDPADNAYVIDRNGDGVIDALIVNTPKIDFVTDSVKTSTSGSTTTVYVPGVTSSYLSTYNVVGYDGLAKDDVVFVTTVNNGSAIYYIQKANTFAGKVTGYSGTGSTGKVYVDSKAYEISPLADPSINTVEEYVTLAGTNYANSITFYTDANGKLAYAKSTATTANLALLLRVEATSAISADTTYQAVLLMLDGTTKVVPLTGSNAATLCTAYNYTTGTKTGTKPTTTYACVTAGNVGVVSYSVDADGNYTLTDLTSGTNTVGDTTYSAAKQVTAETPITKNKSQYDGTNVADASTVFIVPSYDTVNQTVTGYTVYTGIANVPSMDKATYWYLNTDTGLSKVVFVYGGSTNTSTTTGNLFYLDSTNYGNITYDSSAKTYSVPGYLAGVQTTLTCSSTVFSNAKFASGTAYNVTLTGTTMTAVGAASAATGSGTGYQGFSGVIKTNTIGSAQYSTYATGAVIYVVDTNAGTVTVEQPSDLANVTDATDPISIYVDSDGNVTAAIITKSCMTVAASGTAVPSPINPLTANQTGCTYAKDATLIITPTVDAGYTYTVDIKGAGTEVSKSNAAATYTVVDGDALANAVITVTVTATDGNNTTTQTYTFTHN